MSDLAMHQGIRPIPRPGAIQVMPPTHQPDSVTQIMHTTIQQLIETKRQLRDLLSRVTGCDQSETPTEETGSCAMVSLARYAEQLSGECNVLVKQLHDTL